LATAEDKTPLQEEILLHAKQILLPCQRPDALLKADFALAEHFLLHREERGPLKEEKCPLTEDKSPLQEEILLRAEEILLRGEEILLRGEEILLTWEEIFLPGKEIVLRPEEKTPFADYDQ
jgi:hypothetical protein